MSTELINTKSPPALAYRRMAEMAAFLARAYQIEVDPAFLDEIAHTAPRITEWAQALGQADLLEGARLLQQAIRSAVAAPDQEIVLDRLAVEYAGLFLMGSENSVDVIESVYLGEEYCLYETPYFEVLEAYRTWDYAKPKEFAEPEDHIASELDFLAVQLGRAAAALEAGDVGESSRHASASRTFVRNHFARWAPQVAQRMMQTAQEPLYLAVAYLTQDFIRLMAEGVET